MVLFLNLIHPSLLFLPPASLCSPQRGDSSLASLRESYASSLSGLEQENRQLRLALAEMHARPEVPSRTCRDQCERAQLGHAVTNQPLPARDRYPAHTQTHMRSRKLNPHTTLCLICSSDDTRHRKYGEEMEVMNAKLQENASRSEGEIHRLFKQLNTLPHSSGEPPCSQDQDTRPCSSYSSSSSSSSTRLTRRNSVPILSSSESAAEGQSSSSENSLTLVTREKIKLSPSPLVRLVTSNPQLW